MASDNKLNNIAKHFRSYTSIEKGFDYSLFDERACQLANLLLEEAKSEERISKYQTHLTPKESYLTLMKFYQELNPEYATRLKKLYHSKSKTGIDFYEVSEEKGSLKVNPSSFCIDSYSSRIEIVSDDTLKRLFIFTHEFGHYLANLKENNEDYILCELPSIGSEFLLKEYLIKNGIYEKEDIYHFCRERDESCLYTSYYIIVIKKIFDLLEKEDLTKENIFQSNELKDLDQNYIGTIIKNLTKRKEMNILEYEIYLFSYMYSCLFSCFMKEHPGSSEKIMNTFMETEENLSNLLSSKFHFPSLNLKKRFYTRQELEQFRSAYLVYRDEIYSKDAISYKTLVKRKKDVIL